MNKIPFRVSPMLATLVAEPFVRSNWVFEEKYDGVRMLAYKEGNNVSLISRNALDRSSRYPGLVAEFRKLNASTLLLDGEIVVFDENKVSRFQLLQQGKGNPAYAVFDCLYRNGKDLRRQPLSARRKVLEQALRSRGVVRLAQRLSPDGIVAFETAVQRGLEGVVGKDNSSPYFEGRSKAWIKVKVNQQDEFVIGGFTAPEGSRRHFGALLLGAYRQNRLNYVGKVGTGFNESTLGALHQQLKQLARERSPFSSDVREKFATFVAPRLVAQIAFTERTKDGKLRHPVYLGLRDDKSARDLAEQG